MMDDAEQCLLPPRAETYRHALFLLLVSVEGNVIAIIGLETDVDRLTHRLGRCKFHPTSRRKPPQQYDRHKDKDDRKWI